VTAPQCPYGLLFLLTQCYPWLLMLWGIAAGDHQDGRRCYRALRCDRRSVVCVLHIPGKHDDICMAHFYDFRFFAMPPGILKFVSRAISRACFSLCRTSLPELARPCVGEVLDYRIALRVVSCSYTAIRLSAFIRGNRFLLAMFFCALSQSGHL